MIKKKAGHINDLHLESAKVDEILNSMDVESARHKTKADRGVRVVLRIPNLKVGLTQPGGSRIEFIVASRNVATNGIAFLHRNYVHPGSKFECSLPTIAGGEPIRVRGKVARCRHVVNMIHEVAVRFDQPIDLPSFAALSQEEEERCWKDVETERRKSAPAEIGAALVVDAVKSQRAVAQVWLQRMGFKVAEAASGAEALTILGKQPTDLVLLDLTLGAESGLDICRSLRQAKFFGIIIAATAESDASLESRALAAGCNGFVSKPITARNLQQAVENAMAEKPTAAASGPIQSTLEQDEALRPLILEFAATLPKLIDELAAALAASEVEKVAAHCKSIKADGGALGFWQITQAADAAIACLAATKKLDEAHRQVSELLHTLQRVSVSKGSEPAPGAKATPKPKK